MLLGVTLAVEPAVKLFTVVIKPAGPLQAYPLVPVEGAVGELPSVSVNTADPKHKAGVEGLIAASVGWLSTVTFVVTCVLRQPVSLYVADKL